jgi:hypothetical protein
MTESDNNQDDSKERGGGQTESARPPLDYFVIPLCLSFPTPIFFFGFVVGIIAAITDPVRSQWIEHVNWIDFTSRVILLVCFVGMCFRKEWALRWTIIVQSTWTMCVIAMIAEMIAVLGLDEFFLLWCAFLAYEILIITACFFALWRCRQFTKNQRIFPSLSAGEIGRAHV